MPEASRLYLFCDRVHPLCRRLAAALGEWAGDGVVELVDLTAEDTPKRFPRVDLAAARETLTTVDRLGNVSRGIEALRRLSRLLPALRRQPWVYRLPGVTPEPRAVCRTSRPRRSGFCLNCGERWMPSLKSSRRGRGR